MWRLLVCLLTLSIAGACGRNEKHDKSASQNNAQSSALKIDAKSKVNFKVNKFSAVVTGRSLILLTIGDKADKNGPGFVFNVLNALPELNKTYTVNPDDRNQADKENRLWIYGYSGTLFNESKLIGTMTFTAVPSKKGAVGERISIKFDLKSADGKNVLIGSASTLTENL